MFAVTLRQPWPWIILNLGWRAIHVKYGRYEGEVLIHSSTRLTLGDWWRAYRIVKENLGEDQAFKIPKLSYDTYFFQGRNVRRALPHKNFPLGQILAKVHVKLPVRVGRRIHSRLSTLGSLEYPIDRVEPIQGIPCKGKPGFWSVPKSIESQIDYLFRPKTIWDYILEDDV